MWRHLMDWRVWLIAFVIFLIVEFPVWGEEIIVSKPRKPKVFEWLHKGARLRFSTSDTTSIMFKLKGDPTKPDLKTLITFTVTF